VLAQIHSVTGHERTRVGLPAHAVDHRGERVQRVRRTRTAGIGQSAGERETPRVGLVEADQRRGVGQALEPAFLGAPDGDAGDELGHVPAAAVAADRVDGRAYGKRHHRRLPAAVGAAVFVNGHLD